MLSLGNNGRILVILNIREYFLGDSFYLIYIEYIICINIFIGKN